MSTGVLGHMQDKHSITFVADDALAEGHDFMFVAQPEGGHIFYRESAISPGVLEDSWAAYRRMIDEEDSGPGDGDREPLAAPMKLLTLAGVIDEDFIPLRYAI